MRIAILDDYQGVALDMADWSPLAGRADITVFRDHVSDADALVDRLAPFEVVCVMRERTPLPRTVIERLPRLKLIASTGRRNAAIDMTAATERGIEVAATGGSSASTVELTWALLLASARGLVDEVLSVRDGGWQHGVGIGLSGKTLGLVGLGNIGGAVARVGQAFGMNVIAWSQNLTAERAAEYGVRAVGQDALFAEADFVSIHLVLSSRTRGLVGAESLARMKPAAILVNTSRGPIVDEAALLDAVRSRRIAGAAVDVFDTEPLAQGHPFRDMPGLLATPHIGYVSREVYRTFYGETVRNIVAWLDRAG